MKGAAATGAFAVMYAAPRFHSFGPKPAYATITGSTPCLSFIDFDTIGNLSAGDRIGTYRKQYVSGSWVVTTIPGGLQPWSAYGVTVETLKPSQRYFHKKGAMIFDSADPTGGDTDLETPGYHPSNTLHRKNILIISEDGDTSDPDDDARGGVIVFQFDTPRKVTSVEMIDIDDGNSTYQTRIRAFSSQADLTSPGFSVGEPGGLLKSKDVPDEGDNSWQEVFLSATVADPNNKTPVSGVYELRIRFKSSGAISKINFDCAT